MGIQASLTRQLGVDKTDIDLNNGKVDFSFDKPRRIDPKEIVSKGIANTVTVDRMFLETRGRLVQQEGKWYLRIAETGQVIPMLGTAAEELRASEHDMPIQAELFGWRENEAVSVKSVKRRQAPRTTRPTTQPATQSATRPATQPATRPSK